MGYIQRRIGWSDNDKWETKDNYELPLRANELAEAAAKQATL